MPYTSTRTVRTVISDGRGPPRVETKTYTDDDGGMSTGGKDFGGFSSRFGNFKISFGGDGDISGGSSYGGQKITQRPQVVGRTTRKERKNPFAGLGKQNYDEIVKRCKAEGCLFEDPEFEAEDSSIFFSKAPPRSFEWRRPKELCSDPKFVIGGASRFDVQQGELGDCWLLAAVASLTCNQNLLNRIIIPEQDFTGSNYCGVFKFNFWHQGEWTQVVVDDRLPTYYNKLVFMHSVDKNEFWSALLEKAYAKLCGSYECLKGGSTSEAMEDFTGGVTESLDLSKAPDNLFTIMLKAYDRGSLMGCSIEADPHQLEAVLPNGLVMGHAYSVTCVKKVDIKTPRMSGQIPLVRVRNPWGNESEWKGAWSDKSQEWKYIPENEKKEIGLTFNDDGEFWMSFDDWKRNFQKLEICNLGPDAIDEEQKAQGRITWEASSEFGEWIPRVNAGGCRNYIETFASNPQYKVTLVDPDDDDDEDLCTMLIGLLQKDRRKKRKEGLDMLTIGYAIYKLKDDGNAPSGPLDMRFFKYNSSVSKSPSFINMREVCGRHKLSPGTYVIIPSTFEPNEAGEFLLRIFTEKAGISAELDENTSLEEQQRWVRGAQSGSIAQSSDPYEGREPPTLGFDQIVKSQIKHTDPVLPDLSKYVPMPCPPSGYGQPSASQPYPYDQSAGYPNYGPAPTGVYNPGYQPMPGDQYNQYNSVPGYQLNQPSQYYPNSAFDVGYNPNLYGQPQYSGAGYQSNQNFPSPYPQSAVGQPTPGAYPSPYASNPGQAYGWSSNPPCQYGAHQPGYPYGQGEVMEHAQTGSQCYAAPPLQPCYRDTFQLAYASRATAQALPVQGANSQGGTRSQPRSPSPIIHNYQEALDFLIQQLKQVNIPITEEDKIQGQTLKESFKKIAGADLEVDAYELMGILNAVFTKEFCFDGFSLDVCRSMVAMHDGDLSGKLGFEEFKQLWQDLRKWKSVFKQFDRDNSGHLSSYELRSAFIASGFHISNRTLSAVIMRFSNKDGEIAFDDFVLCAIRLKTMLASFKNLDKDNHGLAAYDIDMFIQTTMYS